MREEEVVTSVKTWGEVQAVGGNWFAAVVSRRPSST
jgi:hypothetical protein